MAQIHSWQDVANRVEEELASRAADHDRNGTFVADNYELLAAEGVMGMMVPEELGGGGMSHAEMCELLRRFARSCPSTALALSMHQHLVAASVWKWKHKGQSEPLLRKVAERQLVLLSTGATDWIDSNGTMSRVDGGYRVEARKVFGSGSPAADVMITSARYDDPEHGPSVLHFPVPMDARGVRTLDDWDALGMRGTGSHTVLLEDVFVPEDAIALRRPQGQWHPAWSVVLTVALPLIMSVYVGVAEVARDAAVDQSRGRTGDPHRPFLVGELEGELTKARLVWRGMVNGADGCAFEPSIQLANEALVCKSLCTAACIATVEKAMEISGGRGFFRHHPLERLLRDVHAAPYHPLPAKKQHLFTGRLAMGLDPLTGQAA
jgi:alkylation response protein AidB-like acyl-CoA dehydrogenase